MWSHISVAKQRFVHSSRLYILNDSLSLSVPMTCVGHAHESSLWDLGLLAIGMPCSKWNGIYHNKDNTFTKGSPCGACFWQLIVGHHEDPCLSDSWWLPTVLMSWLMHLLHCSLISCFLPFPPSPSSQLVPHFLSLLPPSLLSFYHSLIVAPSHQLPPSCLSLTLTRWLLHSSPFCFISLSPSSFFLPPHPHYSFLLPPSLPPPHPFPIRCIQQVLLLSSILPSVCRLQENEDLVLTPFEKNLEFWRQLWRVVERRWVPLMLYSSKLLHPSVWWSLLQWTQGGVTLSVNRR